MNAAGAAPRSGIGVVENPADLVDDGQVLAVVRSAFEQLAGGGAVQPPQTVTTLPDGGDVITYQGVLARENLYGVKVSPYLPQSSGAVVTAWTLLVSTRTGRPLLLVNSAGLTTLRTAATTALAVDALAPRGSRVLTVVGSGPVAAAHLRFARALRAFDDVRVVGRDLDRAERLAQEFPGARAGTDVQGHAEESDVVLLCTSAAETVVDVTRLRPGALVTSVSTNAPQAREIDPAAVPGLDVYCDLTRTTTAVAGELVIAAREGWDPASVRAELSELVTGSAPPPRGDRVVFFRSVGLGIEDVAVVAALLPSTNSSR